MSDSKGSDDEKTATGGEAAGPKGLFGEGGRKTDPIGDLFQGAKAAPAPAARTEHSTLAVLGQWKAADTSAVPAPAPAGAEPAAAKPAGGKKNLKATQVGVAPEASHELGQALKAVRDEVMDTPPAAPAAPAKKPNPKPLAKTQLGVAPQGAAGDGPKLEDLPVRESIEMTAIPSMPNPPPQSPPAAPETQAAPAASAGSADAYADTLTDSSASGMNPDDLFADVGSLRPGGAPDPLDVPGDDAESDRKSEASLPPPGASPPSQPGDGRTRKLALLGGLLVVGAAAALLGPDLLAPTMPSAAPAAEAPAPAAPAAAEAPAPAAPAPAAEAAAPAAAAADVPADPEAGDTGRPAADKPAADKPAADKPAADKPAADKPVADKAVADKAAADRAAADRAAADKAAADKAAADRAAADRAAADRAAADKAAADKAAADKAAADPGEMSADELLAAARRMRGNPAGAAALLSKGVERMPRDHHLREALAEALLADGRAAEALPHAEAIVKRRSKRASYRVLYGQVLAGTGDTAAAREQWEIALKIDPDNHAATHLLGR